MKWRKSVSKIVTESPEVMETLNYRRFDLKVSDVAVDQGTNEA